MTIPPALRSRDFRIFWSGLVLSNMGSQFTTVAMAWQIYELTDSPLQVGLIGLARAVPQLAMQLFGGLLADAFDRRRLLMLVQVGQLLVTATLFALALAAAVTPLALYVSAGLLALFTALENPARQAIVPNLVPREDLSSALALNSTQRTAGTIAGPSLAGLVLAFAGPTWCYAVDTVSWCAMVTALFLIHPPKQLAGGRGSVSLKSLQIGLDFVRSHPIILTFMALDFVVTFFGTPRALLPVYARDILDVGPTGLGVLYAAGAIGSVVAATAMSVISNVRRAGLGVLIGVTVFGAGNALFAISHVFWLSVLMLAIAGAGDTISTILRSTINQLSTPDELRGRVVSVNTLFTNGGPQLGQFRSGAVAERWGAELSAFTGGLAVLAVVAGLLAVPRIRRFEMRADAATT